MNKDELAAALSRVVDDSELEHQGNDSVIPQRHPVSQQMLDAVRAGHLPTLAYCPVPLYQGEVAHFCFDGVTIVERHVVGEKVVGSHSSFTLFGDDYAFTFGGSEARVVRKRADVSVARGLLALTNHRFVVAALERGISLGWPEVLNVSYGRTELTVTPANCGALRLRYHDPELLAWCVSACRGRICR